MKRCYEQSPFYRKEDTGSSLKLSTPGHPLARLGHRYFGL